MKEYIKIEKGENYLTTAKKLSDLIRTLPLTAEQNDTLVYAIMEHVNAGRIEAYKQGFGDVFNPDVIKALNDCAPSFGN